MEKEFDIDLAKRIAEEYGLSSNTVASWKQRGAIPAKYTTDPRASKEAIDALVELLGLPGLNGSYLCKSREFSMTQYNSIVGRGTCSVSPKRVKMVAQFAITIADTIEWAFANNNHEAIKAEAFEFPGVSYGALFSPTLKSKVSRIKNGHAPMTDKVVEEVKPMFMEFTKQLRERANKVMACL